MKQTATDGLLGSLFLKTPFEGAEIVTKSPFKIHSITHNQDGYMISYLYLADSSLEK